MYNLKKGILDLRIVGLDSEPRPVSFVPVYSFHYATFSTREYAELQRKGYIPENLMRALRGLYLRIL